MRSLSFYLIVLVLCALMSCKSSGDGHGHTVESAEAEFEVYGAELKDAAVISLAKGISQLEGKDSLIAMITGRVDEVCQMKGCWMTVVDDAQNEVHVSFKDYGFFVPTDLDGEAVEMYGKLYRSVTSVDELKHYAEDAGEPAEVIAAIVEPEEELKFVATGVRVFKN